MSDTPSFGPKQIGAFVPRLARKAFRSRGFMLAEVVTRWRDIAGERLAQNTLPIAIDFPAGRSNAAALTLRVAPGFAPEVQHTLDLIIERVNAFYGYGAVARIKLTHGPIAPPARNRRETPSPRAARPLDPGEQAAIDAALSPIKDPGLREALGRLGRQVLSKS